MSIITLLSLCILTTVNVVISTKPIVRFGSQAHVVDPEKDLIHPTTGENLIHHHKRHLGSLIHDTLRSKLIYLPESLPDAAEGTLIEFELFDGMVVLGSVTHLSYRSEESIGWNGDVRVRLHPENHEVSTLKQDLAQEVDGYFGLSCYQKACSANLVIYSHKEEYLIHPSGLPHEENGYGVYALSQISLDPSKKTGVTSQHVKGSHVAGSSAESMSEMLKSKNNLRTESNVDVSAKVDTDLIYDIVVLYTPEAVISHAGGSEATMKSMINLANDQSNTILSNSAVNMRYRIVGIFSAGANFVEPGTDGAFDTLLDWLTTPGDGKLDIAQSLRTTYGADSVLLVNKANAYCGLAWVNTGFSPNYAYSNYNAGCLYGSVWAHEIGHNMGCYHDRYSDATTAASRPTYPGFGDCWEDASKTDCTCYSSVMIYECKTPTKSCTTCTAKNHYANYLVTESGNPTGRPESSCGYWIDQNRLKPIAYRNSIQPGGMISAISPNFALGVTCSTIKISGWSLSLTGNDITSVTLDGVPATILSRSKHEVTVSSPKVASPNGVPGSVVVTTSTGRVTTLTGAFTFQPANYVDFQDFTAKKLPSGIWSDNGTIPWSFSTDNGNSRLFKDGGLGSSESFYTRLLWQSQLKDGCMGYASSLKFQYWAYSSFSFCYDKFTVSYQTATSKTWTVAWSVKGGSNSGATPWLNASISLPSQTTGIAIFANTAINANCRSHAPVKIDNLATSLAYDCSAAICTASTFAPASAPTRSPTSSPAGTSPTRPPMVIAKPNPALKRMRNKLLSFF